MKTAPTVSNSGQTIAGDYLTFSLGRASYGIAISKVREVIPYRPSDATPRMSNPIRGIINLGGAIVTVVNLRPQLDLPSTADSERTRVIVVQVELSTNVKPFVGLIVDAFEDVTTIAETDLQPKPEPYDTSGPAYILGVAKVNGAVKVLLNIDSLIESINWTFAVADRSNKRESTNSSPINSFAQNTL